MTSKCVRGKKIIQIIVSFVFTLIQMFLITFFLSFVQEKKKLQKSRYEYNYIANL